jgi:hypothetical protein
MNPLPRAPKVFRLEILFPFFCCIRALTCPSTNDAGSAFKRSRKPEVEIRGLLLPASGLLAFGWLQAGLFLILTIGTRGRHHVENILVQFRTHFV